jgi:hypothetical protein
LPLDSYYNQTDNHTDKDSKPSCLKIISDNVEGQDYSHYFVYVSDDCPCIYRDELFTVNK